MVPGLKFLSLSAAGTAVLFLLSSYSLVSFPVDASPVQVFAPRSSSDVSFFNAHSQGKTFEFGTLGTHGAVSCELDICSNIGAELLQRGGSAADAMIGTALCVGSVNSFHSGLGGGGFGLVREKGGKSIHMIDFREKAPSQSYENMFNDNPRVNASTMGGLAVGVPGALKAWKSLHDRYGILSWKEIFDPVIQLNRNGFKIPHDLAQRINITQYPFLCSDPVFKQFYCPHGTALTEGQLIRKERLANTLELISKHGIHPFYQGHIAKDIVKSVQDNQGIMQLQDLNDYEVVWRKPNHISFANKYKVYAGVAPSSGNVVLSTLKTIDKFGDEDVGINITTHRLIEANKFSYGERTTYGDPAYTHNVSFLETQYLDDDYALEKKNKICDTRTFNTSYYNPTNSAVLSDSGTSHITVVDQYGLAITLTNTINTIWGSQVVTKHGFLLNNEMDDFSKSGSSNSYGLIPTVANFIKPGKRPLSSISPIIVEDLKTGQLLLATGSAGGSRIITAVTQIVFEVLRGGKDLQSAINSPRWHDQLSPNSTTLEKADAGFLGVNSFDPSVATFLTRLGHNISYVAPGQTTAQGVQVFTNQTLLAAAEIRQHDAKGAAF